MFQTVQLGIEIVTAVSIIGAGLWQLGRLVRFQMRLAITMERVVDRLDQVDERTQRMDERHDQMAERLAVLEGRTLAEAVADRIRERDSDDSSPG